MPLTCNRAGAVIVLVGSTLLRTQLWIVLLSLHQRETTSGSKRNWTPRASSSSLLILAAIHNITITTMKTRIIFFQNSSTLYRELRFGYIKRTERTESAEIETLYLAKLEIASASVSGAVNGIGIAALVLPLSCFCFHGEMYTLLTESWELCASEPETNWNVKRPLIADTEILSTTEVISIIYALWDSAK